jgi:hypothetical protein
MLKMAATEQYIYIYIICVSLPIISCFSEMSKLGQKNLFENDVKK